MKASIIVLAAVACGDHRNQPPPANTSAGPVTATCAATATELKSYLTSVWDAAASPVPPWPTGDAATDRALDDLRAKLRKAAAPADSGQKAAQLASGIKPGPLDHELAACAPATAQLEHIGRAETSDEKTAAFVGIADAVKKCDCKMNVPFVRALLYMLVRGPD